MSLSRDGVLQVGQWVLDNTALTLRKVWKATGSDFPLQTTCLAANARRVKMSPDRTMFAVCCDSEWQVILPTFYAVDNAITLLLFYSDCCSFSPP